MKNTHHELSEKAVSEFQDIYQQEFGKTLTDDEANEMATRLLRLFQILTEEEPIRELSKITVTESEFKALQYIHISIYHHKKQPTVRGIAAALGLKSSRSGFRMLAILIRRGLVYRNEKGELEVRKYLIACDAMFCIR